MTRWNVAELDIFFISFDEPEADDNFAMLAALSPRKPQRVHGVAGLHKAYATAAERSRTARLITVDGDNRILADGFFRDVLDDRGYDDVVFAYRSVNTVNGLIYGNGGIKCWPRQLLLNVPTHEKGSVENSSADFHHVYRYWRLATVASENAFAVTPFHAFRGAYREAIKLSLIDGRRLESWTCTRRAMSETALSRLLIWLCVGMDAPNGRFSLVGARRGLLDFWQHGTANQDTIGNYDRMAATWNELGERAATIEYLEELGKRLQEIGLVAPILSAENSAWFKQVYVNPFRTGLQPHEQARASLISGEAGQG